MWKKLLRFPHNVYIFPLKKLFLSYVTGVKIADFLCKFEKLKLFLL